jgi:hypothetical protein
VKRFPPHRQGIHASFSGQYSVFFHPTRSLPTIRLALIKSGGFIHVAKSDLGKVIREHERNAQIINLRLRFNLVRQRKKYIPLKALG